MAIEKCTVGNGPFRHHKWSRGLLKECHCLKCGQIYMSLRIPKPTPEQIQEKVLVEYAENPSVKPPVGSWDWLGGHAVLNQPTLPTHDENGNIIFYKLTRELQTSQGVDCPKAPEDKD